MFTRRVFIIASIILGLAPLSAAATESRAPVEHEIRIVSDLDNFRMYFSPRTLRIAPGDRVTWINEEAVDHNVLTYPDGFPQGAEGFESPFLTRAEERWSITLETPGTYEYHCMPHLLMGMHATIHVGEPELEPTFHEPSADEVRAYRDKLLEFFDFEDIESIQRARAGGD